MSEIPGNRACIPRCKTPVPAELDSVGLCIHHFTRKVEEECAEMHRQVALLKAGVDRRAEMASYIGKSALLLAGVISNLSVADELKRRILCTFLSLMNLKEKLERVPRLYGVELLPLEKEAVPGPSGVNNWLDPGSKATLRSPAA